MVDERNPDLDPYLRVMKRFREFLCDQNRNGITCPKGIDVMEVCINFHSKETCTCGCSHSQTSLQGQTLAEYIRFLDRCRSGFEAGNYNRKRKIRGNGRNFRDGWQSQQQYSWDSRGGGHWVREQKKWGDGRRERIAGRNWGLSRRQWE